MCCCIKSSVCVISRVVCVISRVVCVISGVVYVILRVVCVILRVVCVISEEYQIAIKKEYFLTRLKYIPETNAFIRLYSIHTRGDSILLGCSCKIPLYIFLRVSTENTMG